MTITLPKPQRHDQICKKSKHFTPTSKHRHICEKNKRSYAVQKASDGSGPWDGQKWQYSQHALNFMKPVFLLISIFKKKNTWL